MKSLRDHAHMQRKTVTVLFCDVTGSTALGESIDPEALREVLAGYFKRMKAIVESHGGTVEKFIGDAVMAVFGAPAAHEDDALRAVRAAAEMRNALPELGLEARIGLNTGMVVTGTEERLATGDAVNVAARLEQAAEPGEVLLGEPTLELVREAVEAEPVEPLELKGKTQPVPAHRLVHLREAPERRHETPFVGRDRELALVREAWGRALSEKRCELVTIVGDAGVGKSRLVAEALAPVEAKVVRGRCLPYGEGITYWPVVEVLKQLDVLPPDPEAAAAIRSLLGRPAHRPRPRKSPGRSGRRSSTPRRTARWQSCSTTSTPARRPSSTSSSTWRSSHPDRRFSSSAWRGRSWPSGARAGRCSSGSSRCHLRTSSP
jgi:class 3 adenylate cyclase